MSPNQISRRTLLSTGGVLAGLGVVGASAFEFASDDDRTPGADGFTAKTVPESSDPLVLIDADQMAQNDAAKALTGTLLDAEQFDDVPDALVETLTNESRTAIDADGVGKVVLVGSDVAPNAGGAVVWADWTDDELLAVLESADGTETRTESYAEHTLYTTGKTSAAVLGTTEFALGTTEVVRNVIDVWHGDAEPVGGETLNSFERTPLEAHVRFTFEDLRLACAEGASPADAYDRITRLYGWVPSTGDGVRLRLRVEPNEATGEVATALRTDLGVTDRDGAGSDDGTVGLSRDVIEDVAVGREHDSVTVEYSSLSDTSDNLASDVVETTVCLTGRSG